MDVHAQSDLSRCAVEKEKARTKRLLLQHEEDGVEQLEVFEKVVDNVVEF